MAWATMRASGVRPSEDARAQALEASGRGRWLALTIGLVALVWASRSLSVSLRAVHALAWEIRGLLRWVLLAVDD